MKTIIALIIVVALAWGAYVLFGKDDVALDATGNNSVENVENNEGVGTTPATTTPSVKEFAVTAQSYSFVPATMRVNKGDTVRVTLNNQAGNHDWVLDEFNARTRVLKAGESETIEFVADESGSFEYYCSVGTHRQMGMKGTLIVE